MCFMFLCPGVETTLVHSFSRFLKSKSLATGEIDHNIFFKLFIRMFGFGGFVDLQLNYCQQVDGYYEK